MQGKWPVIASVVVVVVAGVAGVIAWRFAFFVAPYAWTEEPSRLQAVLGIKPGDRLADIGAGNGALAVEMARLVNPSGLVYATEISAEQRAAIAERSTRASGGRVHVIEAAADRTNLPAACCDAIYMRAVFHHIADQRAFAKAVTTALQPGGRVAIIDFAPGTLWFHGSDHGVTPEQVTAAFQDTGLSLSRRIDDWGGGMFLLLFAR